MCYVNVPSNCNDLKTIPSSHSLRTDYPENPYQYSWEACGNKTSSKEYFPTSCIAIFLRAISCLLVTYTYDAFILLFTDVSCGSCSQHNEPVCGSNGKTYRNKCQLKLESCQTRRLIQVRYEFGKSSACGKTIIHAIYYIPYSG